MLTVDRGVERKFVADDGFQLPSLMELIAGNNGRPDPANGPVVEGDPVRERLSVTYFDTADLRLAAAGLTLRRRTGGDDPGWQLEVTSRSAVRSQVRLPLGRSARTVPVPL